MRADLTPNPYPIDLGVAATAVLIVVTIFGVGGWLLATGITP